MQAIREVSADIYRIDVNHTRPKVTCCYLFRTSAGAALVDCGGGHRGEAAVLAALKALAMEAEEVRWLLVTHAHLDHAGAAGQLMQQLPQATFAAHPSALKHLIDPGQALEPASRALYGEDFFNTYYGGLTGIAETRTQALTDGEVLTLGERRLQVLFTPGHAWHHVSFYDETAGFIAAGDAYGLSYHNTLGSSDTQAPLVVPVTPPSQFNPPALCASIERLQSLNAGTIGLAHFDTLDMTTHADLYCREQLQALAEWQKRAEELFAESPEEQFEENMKVYLLDWVSAAAAARGYDAGAAREQHNLDSMLSASGFAYYMKKKTAAAANSD